MDVTVASSSGSKIKNEETEGSGGGCNLIRRNVLIPVLLFLAIALLRKKSEGLTKNPHSLLLTPNYFT